MIDLVRNGVEAMNLDLDASVRRASLIPATIAGVADRKGSLDPGKDADIVLLETRPRLEVRMTLSRGEVVYDANR
jgi:N-acetylglucosamine-6-phosphate deacetylase